MLRPYFCLLIFVSTLALSVIGVVGSSADADKEEKVSPEEEAARTEARRGVDEIVELLGDSTKAGEIKKKARDLSRKMIEADFGEQGVDPVMSLLKLRDKGGLGVGLKAGTYNPDGIEAKIMGLAKKKLTAVQMKDEGDDIARIALVTAAIAEVTEFHKPEKKIGRKAPNDWEKWSKDMRDSALELADLAKAKKPNPDTIKSTAMKLNSTCTNCHDMFRPAVGPGGLRPEELPLVGPEAPPKEKKLDLRGAVEEIEMMIHDHKESSARQLAEELGPKKAKLKSFMELYQPAEKGGLDAVGIEKCISELADARKKLDALDAAEQAATFIRMSRLIVAITMIAEVNDPPSFKEKWNQATEEVQVAALELGKAARADDLDGDRIKAAAVRIQKGCASCHDHFRK